MGFQQLLSKVHQAEAALEARERRVVDDWQQLRSIWKEAWTPGRLIIAGLAAGFVVGRSQPLKAVARSGQWMQLVTLLSGLMAGGSELAAAAQAAAYAAMNPEGADADTQSDEAGNGGDDTEADAAASRAAQAAPTPDATA